MATLAAGSEDLSRLADHQPVILAAISCGAVFFGAMTYVGNGPNLMVKAIVEQTGVRMPSFLKYSALASLVLIPVCMVVTLIFFGGG